MPEGPSLSQFLSQSDDPSQASQWSRSIVILVGEKEREVPDRLTLWSIWFKSSYVVALGRRAQFAMLSATAARWRNAQQTTSTGRKATSVLRARKPSKIKAVAPPHYKFNPRARRSLNVRSLVEYEIIRTVASTRF